jgi:alpha-beta hydrolase superfamily lysophospholipase
MFEVKARARQGSAERPVDSNVAVMHMKRAGRAHTLTYPKTFRARRIAANGTKLYVRVGGEGPAVVLLHGYAESGDMWVPLAKELARNHTVVVPDLRGMGLSAKPADGYDKKTQAGDVAGILDALKIERAALVTHDIGNMVGYAHPWVSGNLLVSFSMNATVFSVSGTLTG